MCTICIRRIMLMVIFWLCLVPSFSQKCCQFVFCTTPATNIFLALVDVDFIRIRPRNVTCSVKPCYCAGAFAASGACCLCCTVFQSASAAALSPHMARLRVGVLQSVGRPESREPHSFLLHRITTAATSAGFLP